MTDKWYELENLRRVLYGILTQTQDAGVFGIMFCCVYIEYMFNGGWINA